MFATGTPPDTVVHHRHRALWAAAGTTGALAAASYGTSIVSLQTYEGSLCAVHLY